MTLPIALTVNGANSTTLRIGSLAVLFSYDTAVAFTDYDGRTLRDPTSYSNTTAKHLSAAGYLNAGRAASRDDFESQLAEALKASPL